MLDQHGCSDWTCPWRGRCERVEEGGVGLGDSASGVV